MAKRAIEFQVHWIFIMIAGALILAFFFGIVQKQSALSETKLSVKLSSQMDAVFTGAIESKGTTQRLTVPRPGIAFSCSNTCDCNWYIGKKPNSFFDNLIFAPDLIKDADAIALALEWKVPFRVANFLYLTNPGIKYYVVHDETPASTQLYQSLIKVLPKEIDYEVISPGDVSDILPEGFSHTRFVFVGVEPFANLGLDWEWRKEQVSGVSIQQGNTLVFYEKEPDELYFNAYPSVWAKEQSALAAIYAADHTMYNCGMRQAFAKLATITQIQADRANTLEQELGRPECVYTVAVEKLNLVAQAAQELSRADLSDPEQQNKLVIVMNAQSELMRQNENILRQGCPAVF